MLFFENLVDGWSYRSVPFRITSGHTAWYQAFSGDQFRWCRDVVFARSAGQQDCPVNPALVASIVIGQSTAATRAVIANLYYESVVFHRPIREGESITTTVRVLGGQEATPRPDRAPRGKVLLGIEAVDTAGRPLVTMHRCALVRKATPHPTSRGLMPDVPAVSGWAEIATDRRFGSSCLPRPPIGVGDSAVDDLADPVTDALGFVRLTGNEARAHRDAAQGQAGRRLVYGGHTLALAQAALSRMLPGLLDVLGWQRLEHPRPVFEEDLLRTSLSVLDVQPVPGGWLAVLEVRTIRVEAQTSTEEDVVQRWVPVVVVADPDTA